MSDIVERLRAVTLAWPGADLMHEAAAEIERLRQALVRIRDMPYCGAQAGTAIEKIAREVLCREPAT